jgi:glycosyltransferase involved in cell wall biosynthesis
MHGLAVCICTHDRPDGLRALLDALDRQRFIELPESRINVIVVDNSAAATARQTCAVYAASGRFPVTFVHEPRRGVAFARNAAIVAALDCGMSHLAFIDDDERPHPTWLQALARRLQRTGAAAAVGPVYPIFEVPPPRWLPVEAYAVNPSTQDGFVRDGHTGNSIIDLSVVGSESIWFDHRFNATGGEDTIFFRRLRQKRKLIAWAHDAVIEEFVPRQRMSLRWLFLRWYRTGAIEAHLGRWDPDSLKGKLVNTVRGFARLAVGILRVAGSALVAGWRKPDRCFASFYTLCRGAGLLASVLGRGYEEYGGPPRPG